MARIVRVEESGSRDHSKGFQRKLNCPLNVEQVVIRQETSLRYVGHLMRREANNLGLEVRAFKRHVKACELHNTVEESYWCLPNIGSNYNLFI